MGGGSCKIILCAHGGANGIMEGNALISYRAAEGQSIGLAAVQQCDAVIRQIRSLIGSAYSIMNSKLAVPVNCVLSSPLDDAEATRNICMVVTLNEDRFDLASMTAIIQCLDKIESLAEQRKSILELDAGWPPAGVITT